MPSPDLDTMFEQLLQDLPSEVEAKARDFKAFTRARKIKTPRQLLRVVLLYCGLDQSLRAVAGHCTLLSEPITDQAVAERLAACRPWIRALLSEMMPGLDRVSLEPVGRFLVLDASCVQAPGAKGTHYRLHLAMNLLTLEFLQVQITDHGTGESLANFALGSGDVVLADQGYAHPSRLIETRQQGAHLIVRFPPSNVPLYGRDGQRLNLAERLKSQASETIQTLPVRLQSRSSQAGIEGWVQAYRLSPQQANQARRRARQRSQKKGHTPSRQTLWLAGWVLIFTTLAPEQLSAQTILDLYRLRWQVEMAIKRWKSLLDVGRLRARLGSPLAEVWLQGKLLYAFMLEKRMRRQLGDDWGQLDGERTATWWRAWKLLQQEVAPLITGVLFWNPQAWPQCLQVLAERRRQRKLQRLPQAALDFLHTLQTSVPQFLKEAA